MKKIEKTTTRRRLLSQEATWFDKLSPLKKDLICIAFLLAIIYVLFFNFIFYGMVFSDSGDVLASVSWDKALKHIQSTEKVDPLWMPYIFGGLPVFSALLFPYNVNYIETVFHLISKIIFLKANPWYVLHYFLMGLFMYLLVRYLQFPHIPSLIAAITMMLNPYAIGLAQAGHGSKLSTLSYLPLLFLLTIYLFQQRNILSFGLFAAAVGTMLLNRHPQMSYYALLVLGCYFIYEAISDLKQQPLIIVKKGVMLAFALIIGFAIYAYEFLPTHEYSQYSIRGGGGEGIPGGLTYAYATNWSFHPLEMLNYVIPSFFGFSSTYQLTIGGQEQVLPLYWGWMPFTDSTVYIGILPLLLVVIALIYKRNRLTIFLSVLAILVFFISFGKHLPIIYNFFFYYMPFFDKFRAPSMILHLIPFIFGILAAYGANFLFEVHSSVKEINLQAIKKRFLVILGLLFGVLFIAGISKNGIFNFLSDFMFVKEGELTQYSKADLSFLKEQRFEVLWKDYIKFTLLIGAIIGLIIIYLNGKLKKTAFAAALVAVLIIDLLFLVTRYIDPKPEESFDRFLTPSSTVQFLKQDTTLNRIFPLGQQFMDNSYMPHAIHSIGGYSPAKIRIYQEIIDSCLYQVADPQFPINMNIVNMLNTKYLIAAGRLPEEMFRLVHYDQSKNLLVYFNPGYLPRAWFVDDIIIAKNKTEIFTQLNSTYFDPRVRAILEKTPSLLPQKSDSNSVSIKYYGAHRIELETYNSYPSLLVLSEVYYPAGWKAYINGTETEIYKTNYILRSVIVPAGINKIEFRFVPEMYNLGFLITHIAWGMTVLLLVIGGIREKGMIKFFKKKIE